MPEITPIKDEVPTAMANDHQGSETGNPVARWAP